MRIIVQTQTLIHARTLTPMNAHQYLDPVFYHNLAKTGQTIMIINFEDVSGLGYLLWSFIGIFVPNVPCSVIPTKYASVDGPINF